MPAARPATAPAVTADPARTADPRRTPLPTLDLLLLAVSIGGISLSGPLISATAAPALAIAFWRNVMSVGVLGPYALLRHRAELRGIGRRALLLAIAAGALLAVHFALWMPSLRMTSVASATALVTTTPLWTILLMRLMGVRAPRLVWLGTIVAFAGVLVLTGVDLSLSPRALLGDALALAAGLAAAGYMLLGAEVRKTVSTTAYTLVCYATTALGLLVICLVAGTPLAGWPAGAWWQIALLMVTAQLLGHSLSSRVVRNLGPSITSTAILLETPGAALIAALWLGQWPPAAAYPAVVLILLGLVLVARGGRR
ncbi:threonine/homoserine efflux transporter RhtA [Streptomyces sp. 1114.5]|uniref:DMT family transporter n=1 Tax=unclassified Streptomyces TaxID=2593676 RepID=UPI000BC8874B|nr:threonine/homoserine efflux transporter RhtA [Streptomyces sp. 1114.5]SOB82232.1 Threonine/homoserine efflux transporter RhtA [Streptomyces sp. 1331.2]